MTGAPARLLVVDDNENNRYTLTQRLKRQGYADLTTAENGREALELMQAHDFDLVLLDVMMPEMTGYDVLERLKADARLRDVPVIMISAVGEVESVVRCIQLGAEDYLPKPFNPVLLQARVGASLEKKRLRDVTRAHLARVDAELNSAREIQLGMVPAEFPRASDAAPAEIFALLQPAREVGGDLYDFFYPAVGALWVVIADVSDKGIPAALFMTHTSSMIRVVTTLLSRQSAAAPTPAQVMQEVNRELCRGNPACMFVTVFLGMIDTREGTLAFCSAGHPKPYVVGAAGRVARIEGPTGIPVGIDETFEYETGIHRLADGDCLFLYTDGVPEATDAAQTFYTEQRLAQTLAPLSGSTPQQIVERVVHSVRVFRGDAPQADDIAAMAVRLKGEVTQ